MDAVILTPGIALQRLDLVHGWSTFLGKSDDSKLLKRIAKGDEAAFSELFDRYCDVLLGYIARMLGGDRVAAEDMAQIVWEKVVRNAASFEGKGLTAWLFTIARNTVLSSLRGSKRWVSDGFEEDVPAINLDGTEKTPGAEELIIEIAEKAELKNRIDKLPDRQRIALLAWLESDIDQKELAKQLGMSLTALANLLFRARKALADSDGEGGTP